MPALFVGLGLYREGGLCGVDQGLGCSVARSRSVRQGRACWRALVAEWSTSIPGLAERVEATASRIGRKAWRLAGEMDEISSAYDEAGLPGEFHEAAADLYKRLSGLKDVSGEQSTEEVLGLITGRGEGSQS